LLAGGLAMLWKLRSLIDASGLRPTEIRLQYARVQEIHLWRYLIYWMGSHPFEVARSEHVKELVFTHDGELAIDAPGGASA